MNKLMFYENMPNRLAYSRKIYLLKCANLFAQLKCKMRLKVVINLNDNMFFYGWKIFLIDTIRKPFEAMRIVGTILS